MRLNDHGLIVRVVEGPLTAASALKMSYAGITKGFTALGAGMMLAATREGSAEALKAELAESQPATARLLTRQTPGMYAQGLSLGGRARRDRRVRRRGSPEHAMLTAAARFYQRIAEDFDGGKKETGALDDFLK